MAVINLSRLSLALLLLLLPSIASSAVLPEERSDLMYHRYNGGGVTIDGPSLLVRKNFADKFSVSGNYYVDDISSASIDVVTIGASPDGYNEERTEYSVGGDYLFEKGLITRFESRANESPATTDVAPKTGPTLNERQQDALVSIRSASGFGAFFLAGVPGSGKTEVYLSLIADALREGKQSLVLVPEIGLTPQLVTRFRDRLGIEPALLHSGLTDLERLSAWRSARAGDARLVVGTRSAIFAPLPNPGLRWDRRTSAPIRDRSRTCSPRLNKR